MKQEKAVVILSGGMDSTTLLYDVRASGAEVYALSFNYGQRHRKELRAASATCASLGINHKVVNLNVLNELAPSSLTREELLVPEGHYEAENMKQTVVPNRNMVLIALAASYAIGIKADSLYYGAHSGDHAIYPDCRKDFAEDLGALLQKADWHPVTLKFPYINMDKGDIAIRGKELGVDYSNTWTCYKGLDLSCGVCGSCQERLEAFDKAGMKDPLKYMER